MDDIEKQKRLNNEFRRLTQNITIKEIYDRTTLRYTQQYEILFHLFV